MDEVSLVRVAVRGRDHAPVSRCGSRKRAHDALEPPDAGKTFRRKASLGAKAAEKCFGQKAGTRSRLRDGQAALQEENGGSHRWIPGAEEMLKEYDFEDAEFVRRSPRLAQALAEQAAIAWPEIAEFDSLVINLAEWHGKESRRAADLEFDGDEPPLFASVNGRRPSVRTRQHRSAHPVNRGTIRSAVSSKLVLFQIDHEVRLAVRKNALDGIRKLAFVVMESSDERRESGRARTSGDVEHDLVSIARALRRDSRQGAVWRSRWMGRRRVLLYNVLCTVKILENIYR